MTSNVGSDILSLQSGELSERTRSEVMDRFRAKGFSPEFLNRIEEVVMFVSTEIILASENQTHKSPRYSAPCHARS